MNNLKYETDNPLDTTECPICFFPLIEKEFISFNTCSHKYHLGCITQWKNSTTPLALFFTCPTCDELRDIDVSSSTIGSMAYTEIVIPRPTFSDHIKNCLDKIFKR
tara:strand:+ start:846 stop:1163 length:318 start_codon:yes stop_codon:yes gene_type:complete